MAAATHMKQGGITSPMAAEPASDIMPWTTRSAQPQRKICKITTARSPHKKTWQQQSGSTIRLIQIYTHQIAIQCEQDVASSRIHLNLPLRLEREADR